MRVLFLDFDGVLHPYGFKVHDTLQKYGKPLAYVEKVDHFCWAPILAERLAAHLDVVVVVHSTWRVNRTLAQIQQVLGPQLGARVRALTPDGPRYAAIQEWLAANKQVRDYRILDDDATSFPAPQPPELIHCHSDLGISSPDVQQQLTEWLDLES